MRRKTVTNTLTIVLGSTAFCIIGIVVCVVIYVVASFTPKLIRITLPIMGKYEYIIDKYGTIHGTKCPHKKSLWFKTKYKKYDILMETDQEICTDCLLFEEEKLLLLHQHNLEESVRYYKSIGVKEESLKAYIKAHSPKYED